MRLATHNSLSSYAPKKWWMKILNPFARCQSLSIEGQYAKGVRMFDIRVRPHTEEAAHGLVTYDVDVDKAKQGWKAKLKSIWEYICHPTPEYWAKRDNAEYIKENKDYQGFIRLMPR